MSTLINRKYWVKPCFEPHGFGLRTFVVEQSDSVKISASSVVPLILPGTAVPSSSAHSSSSFYGKRKIERVEEPSPNLILQLKTNSPSAFNGHFHFDRSCFKIWGTSARKFPEDLVKYGQTDCRPTQQVHLIGGGRCFSELSHYNLISKQSQTWILTVGVHPKHVNELSDSCFFA